MSAIVFGCWRNERRSADDTILVNFRRRTISRAATLLFFSRIHFRVATAFLASEGRPFSQREFAEIVWSDEFDGGPETWANSISQAVLQVRRKLARIGIEITAHQGLSPFSIVHPGAGRLAA